MCEQEFEKCIDRNALKQSAGACTALFYVKEPPASNNV